MDTIAVANRKGGVGKSSVATNLSAALALAGRRVLLIDMDSQGSATQVLLEDASGPTTAEVLAGERALEAAIRPSTREGLWIAPSRPELTQVQLGIAGRPARETLLRRALLHW